MGKLIIQDNISAEDYVHSLLENCDIKNPPTDSSIILDKLKLRQLTFDFMKDIPVEVSKDDHTDPSIRAVLSVRDRIVAVHSGLHFDLLSFH